MNNGSLPNNVRVKFYSQLKMLFARYKRQFQPGLMDDKITVECPPKEDDNNDDAPFEWSVDGAAPTIEHHSW